MTFQAFNSNLAVRNKKEDISNNSNHIEKNKQSNHHFFISFIKKNKKEFILVAFFYAVNSLILTSYGLLFYFISTKLYSTDKDELGQNGCVLGAASFVLGAIYTTVQALQM